MLIFFRNYVKSPDKIDQKEMFQYVVNKKELRRED